MDCLKIFIFIFTLSAFLFRLSFADCIDSYGIDSYRKSSTLIPEISVLFKEIDEDTNDFLSFEELQKSSSVQKYDYIDLLIIWSFRESYDYIVSLSNDEYFFENSGLSINDVRTYISNIINDKGIEVLIYKMSDLSYGLMPSGLDSISHQYIYQKKIRDCGLIAAISSLAYSRRTDIYNMISPNEDGSFNVNFPSKRTIKMAPSVEVLFKGARAAYEGFWLLVLEISFLKLVSDESLTITKCFYRCFSYLKYSFYQAIGKNTEGALSRRNYEIDYSYEGIPAEKAISILTGNPSKMWRIYMSTPDEVRDKMYELTNYNKIAVASFASSYYKYLCEINLILPMLPIDSCYKNLIPPYENLPGNHYYSILFYDNENDSVTLRNPWGSRGEPLDPVTKIPIDGRDDGIFIIKIELFMKIFDHIEFEE